MSAMWVLIPLAMILSGSFVAAFFWATQSDQWNDLDLPAQKLVEDKRGEENGD